MKKYTIEQIKEYLNGCILIDREGKDAGDTNVSLRLAISLLNNYEDGIIRMAGQTIPGKQEFSTYRGYEIVIRKIAKEMWYPWEFIYRKSGASRFLHDCDSYNTKEDCIEAAKEQIDKEVKCATKLTNKKKKIPKK